MEYLTLLAILLKVYWAISDPVQILRQCIKDEEWFRGIVLSTAFFEGIGKAILQGHFHDRIASEKFKHIQSVDRIILLLYVSGRIKQPTYSKMVEVNRFRNAVVHFPLGTPQEPLEPEEAKRIIQKAISCLKILIRKVPPMQLKSKSPNQKL